MDTSEHRECQVCKQLKPIYAKQMCQHIFLYPRYSKINEFRTCSELKKCMMCKKKKLIKARQMCQYVFGLLFIIQN